MTTCQSPPEREAHRSADAALRPVVLVVDDDDTYRGALARAFERRGYEVLAASSLAEAVTVAEQRRLSFASVDLRMPGVSGLELVRQLTALQPEAVVVVLTGYGSIATAVEAVKLGARDYLTKPADANDLLRAFGVLQAAPPPANVARSVGREPSNTACSEEAREVPSLARVEWEHISRVVSDCGGNISRAARLLRMQRRSLQRKLAKYPVSR